MDFTGSNNGTTEAINLLENFWPRIQREVNNLTTSDFKNPELPLARIKKIMKLDDEVKMISAEAPIVFAKAAELFIQEVTNRAWLHTEENKRRTLQRNDVALAVSRYEQFDFLIDIVPREEIAPKPTTGTPNGSKKENSSTSPNNSINNVVNNVNSNTTTNTTGTNNQVFNLQNQQQVMNAIINPNDPQAASLINALSNNQMVMPTQGGVGGGQQQQIIINGTNGAGVNATNGTGVANGGGGNVQYVFASNNSQGGAGSCGTNVVNGGGNNLQGFQATTTTNQPQPQQQQQQLGGLQQGVQGVQGLQQQNMQGGAQVVLNASGQPTVFSLSGNNN